MKSIRIFTLLYVLLFILIGCQQEKEPVSVTGITLSQSSFSLIEGEVHTLTVNIEPSNADNKSVFWTSSQESVASVQDGVVSAYKSGNTTITAKSVDGGKTATCEVIVLAKEISVESVSLDKTSVEMTEGDEITLAATITPDNATNKNVIWTSSDERIVSVDNGKVTAILEGTATITVTTEDGRMAAFCSITVLCPENSVNYIDEYGINQGKGVLIGGVIWAPVNCGYHATDFKYGKLYQWGRKYGQGYSGDLFNGEWVFTGEEYADAILPIIEVGPVSLSVGQLESNANVFYKLNDEPYDWVSLQNVNLWNNGTIECPIKTEYDPCPDGWRVPSYMERVELTTNYSSSLTINENNQYGCWLSGPVAYADDVSRIFLPCAGERYVGDGEASNRGYAGEYWTSQDIIVDHTATSICFYGGGYFWVGAGGPRKGFGCSVRCVQDDKELIPVETITLSSVEVSLLTGESEAISVTILPSNANHQKAYWWSDNPQVADVDEEGNVFAFSEGTTIITAMAGMQFTTCQVIVNAPSKDYVDEYGINHGAGTEIGGIVWAPVNCGYHETDYPYGKLYQWGRKYGQGYSGEIYDINGNYVAKYSDAYVPSIESGPVSMSIGQSMSNSNVFYTSDYSKGYYDWISPHNDNLWNFNTESVPIKTEYDPCPDGWRVPSIAELYMLINNYSVWTTDEKGHVGYWFSGPSSYSSNTPKVFFPAAGYRDGSGITKRRNHYGYYWSSSSDGEDSGGIYFGCGDIGVGYGSRINGNSVRCVQK